MSFPHNNEKAQSERLPAEVIYFMQNQAVPTYHHVLKLGLGLGGILNILCVPAMAEPFHSRSIPTRDEEMADSTPAEPVISQADTLEIVDNTYRQAERAAPAATAEPQPKTPAEQLNLAGRRLLISESTFIPEPKLSSAIAEKIASSLDIRTPEAVGSAAAINRLASRPTASGHLDNRHLEPSSDQAPRFSPVAGDESRSSATRTQHSHPLVLGRHLPTVQVADQPELELEAKTETERYAAPDTAPDTAPNEAPWSVNKLTASDGSSSLQTVAGSELQHVGLDWGDADDNQTRHWINDLAPAIPDTSSVPAADVNSGALAHEDSAHDASRVIPSEIVVSEAIEAISSETKQLTSRSDGEINSRSTAVNSTGDEPGRGRGIGSPDDLLSEILEDQGVVTQVYPVLDEELGTLRLLQLRSRQNEELGILRILRTAQAAPPKPPTPIAFLGGRLGFVDVDNVIRTNDRIEEQIYQAGTSLYLVPKLSQTTSLYAIAETNVARYNNISDINYNEIQLQVGLRQRLLPRTFAQVGWRNQRLYSPGYREKLFGVNYVDALVSHRSVLSTKIWLDSFYQMRLGFADPKTASRFRQTMTLSLNYGVTRNLRTSLLYQLDLDDYTQIPRYDTYQQVLGIVSYSITPESRISVFGGTRFGNSSEARVNLDDTFYGAGLNVSVPLF